MPLIFNKRHYYFMNIPNFEKILCYFEAVSVSKYKNYSVYIVNGKTIDYSFYFFKSENLIKCFSTNYFKVISELEMVYILSDRTDFVYISTAIKAIELSLEVAIANDIKEDQLVEDIISVVLDIQIPASGFQNQVFESVTFENKVFVNENIICFPLFNNKFKLTNIALISGKEVNNNTGVFLSNRLQICKELVVFFNPKSLILHTESFFYQEYYYALFASNIDISDFSLIFDLSDKFSLPITLYLSNGNDFSNAFKLCSSFLFNFPPSIRKLELSSNPNQLKFHIYSASNCVDIMPLNDLCQEINRALIIHYNEEIKIPEEDISKSLKFIETSSAKLFECYEMNISFPAHADALCSVLNALGKLYGLKKINFKHI